MQQQAEAQASPRCGLEVELRKNGEWVAHECGEPAKWSLSVSVGGPLSERSYRCEEHLGGTIDFHLGIPSTESLLVTRVA